MSNASLKEQLQAMASQLSNTLDERQKTSHQRKTAARHPDKTTYN